MKEIKCFDPFFAEYDSYDGRHTRVSFTCPYCGGHSVKRCINSDPDDTHFFQGHFRCKTCCKGSFLNEPFYYASSCFVKFRSDKFEQLTLF